jgi:hypothetical protein
MPVEYEDDAEVQKLVQQLIRKHHPRLMEHKVRVKGLLKVKTDKDGEVVKAQAERVKLTKVSDVYKSKVEADFLIMVDAEFWQAKDPRDREPAINFALCGIEVEVIDGKKKVKTRKPDIVDYSENVRLYGAHSQPLLNVLDFASGIAGVVAKHVTTAAARVRSDAAAEPQDDGNAKPKAKAEPAPIAAEDDETLPAGNPDEPADDNGAPAATTDEGDEPPPVPAPQEDEGEEAPPPPPPPPVRVPPSARGPRPAPPQIRR